MWGLARNGAPEAGGYAGVQVGADAPQEDGPDDFDLRDCTDYGAPVVWAGPVPFFIEGADSVCPVCRQGGLPFDDVPGAVGKECGGAGRGGGSMPPQSGRRSLGFCVARDCGWFCGLRGW